jgi:hypothetical protein
LFLGNASLSFDFFKLSSNIFDKEKLGRGNLFNFFRKISKFLPLGLVSILLFYIVTNEYLSKDIIWMFLILPAVFYNFILTAMIYSLKRVKDRIGVDIHFIDKSREIIRSATILKVNDDNIRVQIDQKVLIINKSEVFKMQMEIPKKTN